jgi:UDPglucose 6-dehydrogenase
MSTNNINIGIVGHGFVGKAVEFGFQDQVLSIVDKRYDSTVRDILGDDLNLSAVFVCLPTPTGLDGDIDTSIVEDALRELSVLKCPIILKSTVIPSVVKKFAELYENFVYNPEFLTEANARIDFVNPPMHVFGGTEEYCQIVSNLYKNYSLCKKNVPEYWMLAEEASLVKYSMNSFLALKVSFWNQIKELADEHGIDYNFVADVVGTDPRIGHSHMSVPGPDGRRGYGSACFAKDIPALIHFADGGLSILKESWNYNCDVRNQYKDLLPREQEQHVQFRKIQ